MSIVQWYVEMGIAFVNEEELRSGKKWSIDGREHFFFFNWTNDFMEQSFFYSELTIYSNKL